MENNIIPKWWQTGTIYQIYPKSFQDTKGTGTGDIKGIIKRLDYLVDLGVDAIWITPFYQSPQIDNGYDVSDYLSVDPSYGTLSDFDELINQAKKRNIRIILDMVLNHTSTEHKWFKESLDINSPYRQFYFWREAKENKEPNNWQSKFGGNAWSWHEESQQYYLHLFSPQQADLNWDNPQVRTEIKNVCQFWLNRGVDGFRLDVINLISKNTDFPNDPIGDGRRFYTDGTKVHEFLKELNREIFKPNDLMTVGEMSSTSLEHCQQYSSLSGSELSMTFNFHHLKVDYPNGEKWTLAKPDYVELKKIMNHWQQGMHKKAWNALFWCNHDQPRIVSRFGDEREYRVESAKMLAMLLYGMQGTPYIYQGEEIGMINPNFNSIDEYKDVESINYYVEQMAKGADKAYVLAVLASKSRDNSRTPMQWDKSNNAGFTQHTPWIKVADNYHEINVEKALQDKNSIFYMYKKLIALRKSEAVITLGDYQDLLPDSSSIWCYKRQWNNEQLIVLVNLTSKEQLWKSEIINKESQCLLHNYTTTPIYADEMILKPFEAIWWINKHENRMDK